MQKTLAEAIGTFTMVFVGAGSVILAERFHWPIHAVAAVWGGVIAVMIVVWASLSGAHFNPAVTLAFALGGKLPYSQVLAYWMAQFFGGATAMLILEGCKRL